MGLHTQHLKLTRGSHFCNELGQLSQTSQDHGADKSSRHGAREVNMIVFARKKVSRVLPVDAMSENVMSGLNVERLFDFGIRGNREMNENHAQKK